MTTTTIIIRWRASGFHSWPNAPLSRLYLSESHRHLFYFEVELGVLHDERDIEFHDLLDDCKKLTPDSHDYGASSCESIARQIYDYLIITYPDRSIRVSVFEDDENGATIQ